MDEGTSPRQMSLIPYAHDSREVVLRRGNAVVLLDPRSHQLSVSEADDNAIDLTECPYCHRPWMEERHGDTEFNNGTERPSGRPFAPDRGYVDPEYFGMLAASQRATPVGSRPPTPSQFARRLFPPALRSGRSRDVSGSSQPPADAEFLTSEPLPGAGDGISSSAFSPGFFKQFFVEKGELGRGGNGVVLLVEHIMDRVSLGQFACKRIPVGNDHSWLEKVLVEVKLLQKIPHQNLVSYHWVWLEDHQPSKFGPSIPCLWILQEYCNGGDLHNHVLGPRREKVKKEDLKQRLRRRSKGEPESFSDRPEPSKLTFEEIFSFFRDITSGLHHLHSKGYIHRDLKPHNCLIQRDGNKTRVLISDFGEVQAAGDKRGSTGATGTISYCAPEVLIKDGPGGVFGDFSTKSDIFSLGMTVYFMCFGRLPYNNADELDEENEDLDELRAEITKWKGIDDETRLRPDLPVLLYRFLKRLLSINPSERPSTEEILNGIKGGGILGEPATTVFPEESFRGTSAVRRPSGLLNRPGLSALGRPLSGEYPRTKSPTKSRTRSTSQSTSRPTSPQHPPPIMVHRQRKAAETRTPSEASTPPRSPLMLPPPETIAHDIWHFFYHPYMLLSVKILVFLAKLLSLSLPCTPYAANAWLLYPLLFLATLDLGVLPLDLSRSLALIAVHTTAVVIAGQHNRLCEGSMILWHDV